VGYRRQTRRHSPPGVASYAAPLLSTLALVVAGYTAPRATLWLAALLIAGGGLLAAKDMLRRKPR
jgi:hypothetical protein